MASQTKVSNEQKWWLVAGVAAVTVVGGLTYYLLNKKRQQKQATKESSSKGAQPSESKTGHKHHQHHSAKRLIFIGPPGSGKGTQGPLLKERYGVEHLSMGDLLRAAVSRGTENGRKAKAAMDAGKLVTDDIVIGIIRDEIAPLDARGVGYILDGFPRTHKQMLMLEDMLEQSGHHLDAVIHFAIDDGELVERICGRLIHKSSGRTYHTKFNPPKAAGKDDVTGEELTRRSDDNEATLTARLKAFHAETAPVIDHYRTKSILTTIDASQSIDVCFSSIEGAIERNARR